nr:signal peptidase I [Nakamurella sp. PAMC28650]
MRTRRRVGWAVFAILFVGMLGVGFGFWHSGYRVYVIHTGSMQPAANPGDLIIDRPASGDYHPGEVITFRHSAGPDLVTHRITDITGGAIHTKGDANASPDAWTIPPALVQGSVRWKVTGLGFVAVFLQQPAGFAALFTVTIGLMLLWKLWFPDPVAEVSSEDSPPALPESPVPTPPTEVRDSERVRTVTS